MEDAVDKGETNGAADGKAAGGSNKEKEEIVVVRRRAVVSPAFVRLGIELVVNALDNAYRSASQRQIRVDVERKTGVVRVSNDGGALPIQPFEDSASSKKRWTVSVAFSEFLSSSNYDDSKERQGIAGKNGVGAKGCNVFSKRFDVEVVNPPLSLKQTWRNNMSEEGEAVVKKAGGTKCRTTVKWLPDYERLGMPHVEKEGLREEEAAAMEALAYGASLCAPKEVGVWLNGEKLKLRTAEQLVKAMGGVGVATDSVLVDGKERFSIAVAAKPERTEKEKTADGGAGAGGAGAGGAGAGGAGAGGAGAGGEGCEVGWLNGTPCSEGTLMRWATQKVADAVIGIAKKRNDDVGAIRPASLKAEMILVAVASVPNPRFTSQQKTELSTPVKDFGFSWSPSPKFLDKLKKSELVERAREMGSSASKKQLAKVSRSRCEVPKHRPAENLRSGKASLLVTEGDSALNFAVAGLGALGVEGRKNFGIFPIRGKLLNCRNASTSKLSQNEEVKHLLQILGLEVGKTYSPSDAKKLPYRRLVILSDQDPDGSHIRGLLLNFLRSLSPSLMEAFPDFAACFATPLLRVSGLEERKSPTSIDFYTESEFREWKRKREEAGQKCGTTKYFKGLGALSNALAKTLFAKMAERTVTLRFTGKECDDRLSLFFDDKRAAGRKEFLETFDPESAFDFSVPSASISEWAEKDLASFMLYNNSRAFPNVLDGLKTSQRKVLAACFKLKITKEVARKSDLKVFQLVGRIAAEMGYHHGDASLTGCVTGMAAEYVGANNVALLWPDGQFGTNYSHSASSSRYISAFLEPISRCLFPEADDDALVKVSDSGKEVEPRFYVPLLPLVLINGAEGIGSGWSTFLHQHCPHSVLKHVLAYLEHRFENGPPPSSVAPLLPWYRGYRGSFREEEGGFVSVGDFEIEEDGSNGCKINVRQLPIGSRDNLEAVEDMRKRLVGEGPGKLATEVNSKNMSVWETLIEIRTSAERIRAAGGEVGIRSLLRIEKRLGTENVHLWSSDSPPRLRKYTVSQIVEEHCDARLDLYSKRLQKEIGEAEEVLKTVAAKKRFVSLCRSGALDLKADTKGELEARVEAAGFSRDSKEGSFQYLIGMPAYSLTKEEETRLGKEEKKWSDCLASLRKTTPLSLWRKELRDLSKALHEYDSRCQDKRPDVSSG